METTPAKNWRSLFESLVPSWLSEGDGGKILWVVSALQDAFLQRALEGVTSRFPLAALTDSSLALIGADRGIIRGRSETRSHYAQRLIGWRYPRGHRTRGNDFALLEQISEYFGGWECYTVDVNGNRCHRSAEGVETFTQGVPWDWDGVGTASGWGRFWVVLIPPAGALAEHPDLGDPELWGGELGDYAYTVGQLGVSAQDVEAIRGLVKGRHPWKPLGIRAEWIVVSLSGADPVPDGGWIKWGEEVAGVYEPTARDAAFRFWSFTPSYNNTYAGDPVFREAIRFNGSPYGGVPTFHETITLPDGSSYGGVPTFHETVKLVDDGDLPV